MAVTHNPTVRTIQMTAAADNIDGSFIIEKIVFGGATAASNECVLQSKLPSAETFFRASAIGAGACVISDHWHGMKLVNGITAQTLTAGWVLIHYR